jgi:hypothetical protein
MSDATTMTGHAAASWDVVEARLTQLSDWLNPILVKETRQAVRSWSFMLTFVLVLVACWVVTIGGVALIGPSIYFAAGGGELFRAYFAVLTLPLLVVVPFAAFRSLVAEREDNTYDVLSITTLRPRQIIGGKLASAVVQMIVYFSAVAPCLAFTYLLRGIDAPTIALLLVYAFLASLALSLAGLLLATLAQQRYGQLVTSVGFVAFLLITYGQAQGVAALMVRSGYSLVGNHGFWVSQFFFAAAYAASLALAYFAAAATITFASENRSTPLRILMLFQQATIVGWVAYLWIDSDYSAAIVATMMNLLCCYWFLMGSMLDGERTELSRRAMRRLPQSVVGRVFFTWLNPGPSSGYVFAVANLTAVLALAMVAAVISGQSAPVAGPGPGSQHLACQLIIAWSYAVAYLGLGRLVVALVRKVSQVTIFASVLLHALLLLAGSGIPTTIQWMSLDLQDELYSYLQITNPIWTLYYLSSYGPAPEEAVLVTAVPAAAICLLLLNLPGAAREMRRVRTALPPRVAEDEAELNPPPELQPTNPWNEIE